MTGGRAGIAEPPGEMPQPQMATCQERSDAELSGERDGFLEAGPRRIRVDPAPPQPTVGTHRSAGARYPTRPGQ